MHGEDSKNYCFESLDSQGSVILDSRDSANSGDVEVMSSGVSNGDITQPHLCNLFWHFLEHKCDFVDKCTSVL